MRAWRRGAESSDQTRAMRWMGMALIVITVAAGCAGQGDGNRDTAPGVDRDTAPGVSGAPVSPSTAPVAGTAPSTAAPREDGADRLVVEVLSTRPHDPDAFTQGLVWHGSGFYESTGLYGESDLREVTVNGEVNRSTDVAEQFFAEGLAQVGDRLIQLTWRAGTALVYDEESFEVIDRRAYDGEGWGLCLLDGGPLVMSDGSDRLTMRDPGTFEPSGSVSVTLDGEPVELLNELECVGDTVWANIWKSDLIVGIEPSTGRAHSVVDASGLLTDDAGVLNGIAHDGEAFWLTGKYWPTMFEVAFVPA